MRRSVRSFNIPPRHLNFLSLVWSNSRAPSLRRRNCVQMPHPIFSKRQNQRPWLSNHRPIFKTWIVEIFSSEPYFLTIHLYHLHISIFKDILLEFRWNYLTLLVQIPYPCQASFKFTTLGHGGRERSSQD